MFESIRKVYPFESNFLTLGNNMRMHYIESGKENSEVMLMVHGNPTWSFYYRNLVKDFSKKYHCIAIDHIGCGFSSKHEQTFRLSDRINHLREFIIKKDLKNINLVAHDWGGAIGVGTVLKELSRMKSVILSNTAAFNSDQIPLSIALSRTKGLGTFLNRSLNAFSLAATFRTTVKPLSNIAKQGYLLPYNNYSNRRAVDDFVKDIPLKDYHHPTYATLHDIEKGLKEMKLPALLLWGDKDFCFRPSFRKKFLDYIPHAKTVSFKDAGHYVLEDAYGKSFEAIDKFLGEVSCEHC